MLPNKTVAIVILTILSLEVLAGVEAQGPVPTLQGADLKIMDIDVGVVRIAGIPARLNVTVKNIGDQPLQSTGWEIFVGLGGLADSNCIERGESGQNQLPDAQQQVNPPCYIRMLPGTTQSPDGTNKTTLGIGESSVYVVMWNASTKDDVKTDAQIFAEIRGLRGAVGSGAGANCSGPDTPNCQNNQFLRTGVNIGALGIRAKPVRQNTSQTDATENDPWLATEIGPDDACPLEPNPVERGCRVPAGKAVVATYTLINSGTVDDSYTPTLNIEEKYLRRGYTFALSPHNFSLNARTQTTVRLTIVIPENETAGEEFNIAPLAPNTVRWESTRAYYVSTANNLNPYCTDPTISDYCRDPTLPSLVIDVRRGFNVTANETFKQVFAGVSMTYPLEINNTGNAVDTFNVSFLRDRRTINDSWLPQIENATPFEFPANTSNNFTIRITPPRNATNGTYTFDVGIKSFGDTKGLAKCKANNVTAPGDLCTVTFVAHLAQSYEIVGLPGLPVRTVPGEPIPYKLTIENKGNGYDNISLDLQSTVGGWDVRLSDRTARLTPFNTTTLELLVTSPPAIPEGTEASFFVNGTSGGPDTTPFIDRSRVAMENKMTIIRGPNLRLTAPVNSSFIDPGATVVFDVNIHNVGNVADNFTIPIPQRPSDWGVVVSPKDIELQPNQAGTVRVSLTAPNSSTVGERASAVVTVLSSVDPSRSKAVTLEGRVSGPDLFVDSVLVNSTSPYSGDPLELSVVVGNNGNKGADKNATLRLYFVQNGVERVIGEKVYAANAIPAQRRVTEIFPWDTTGIEGSGVLLARIDVDNTVPEIDDTAASNEKTRALTLRTFDIKLTPAQGLTARPGEKVTYGEAPNVVLVEYRGNQPSEPVSIRFESEHGWLSSQSELSLALPRGTPIPVIASIEVPARPGAGKDTLTVTVVPALRANEALRATTITTVLDEEKPIVPLIRVTPAAAKLGEPVNIEATLEDATGISAATAYVTLPTNETSAVVLSEVAPGRWNATRAFTFAGTYVVRVEAADDADPPNINKTRATSATFTISPGSAPTIKLADGQSSTVRTGTPVRLTITDPLGIGKVTYSIKGVNYELRGPDFAIDTSTFAEGPVDVIVTAENIYGIATTQRIALTVDNAPPGITKVTMVPERPKANEDVTLTIAVESQVQAVDVLVKRDGQVVQTINATRKGVGTFEAKFNPGEGDYVIDVTARDTAGNTKLVDGAVTFTAKPGSPFKVPGLTPMALGLALVALALLLRRRR